MEEKTHKVKILEINQLTHDVKRFKLEKPEGYKFTPGQATEISIKTQGFENEKRPFTFTSLNEEPNLEFTIKIYKEHNGVTNELDKLKVGDYFIIKEPWGAIKYKGAGIFIAGGAGITPFIAILKNLEKENKTEENSLYFSNKTEKDIILKDKLKNILGENAHFILTREENENYETGRIDEKFLKEKIKDFKQHFYVCGPKQMVKEVSETLKSLGAHPDNLIFEK